MKIVILFFGQYPSFNPGAKRVDLYKKSMEEAGYAISILCPPKLKQYNALFFILNSFLEPFFVLVWALMKIGGYSHWILYKPTWASLSTLGILAKLTNKKLALEVNEKPAAPYGNRFTELSLVKCVNSFMMLRVAFPFFVDGFVVISAKLEAMIKKLVPDANIIRIPVLVDFTYMTRKVPTIKVEHPYFIHAGALSERKDGILAVFEALGIVNNIYNKSLHFYLTSSTAPSAVQDTIQKTIFNYHLEDKIHYREGLDEDTLLGFLKRSSFFVINKYENEQNRYNFSTKLAEYMAVGKPVITTGYGEVGRFLEHGKNALFVPPHNPDELARTMVNILEKKYNLLKIEEASQEIARTIFSYQNYGKLLGQFMQQLV